MKLNTREVKAFIEMLEAAEKYKPFQVAKRRIARKYGLAGSRLDRLATAIIYKMYRLQGILDQVVKEAEGLDVRRLPPYLRQAYRLVVYLSLYDDVGDKELVRQIVGYVSRIASTRFSGRDAWRLRRLHILLTSGKWAPSVELSIETRLLLPRIIIDGLLRLLGSMDEVEKFAKAVNDPRPVYGLRVNTLKSSLDEVLQALERVGIEAWPSQRVPNHIRYLGGLPYDKFQLLHEGKVVPQDEASAAAGLLLGPKPGERVADLCAAPGGKTTHIAELQQNKGLVVAVEIYPDRIARLVELVSRTGTITSVVPLLGDALRSSSMLRGVDRVLLDPPCSSTGALARHPEARWRLTSSKLMSLARRQYAMLAKAANLLPPGGRLLYTVCSIMPEEGEEVIKKALTELPLELVPLEGPYSQSPILPGTMRAWPHIHRTTGFFYALLEKK